MKFHTAALQFLVASEALRFGVRAQSVVVDRMSNTNVADAAVSDVLLETLPADSGGRFFPTGINNLRVVSRRNLAAANSNEGSTEDFDALTERKKEAEPADVCIIGILLVSRWVFLPIVRVVVEWPIE